MTKFHERDFGSRFWAMGETSEKIFEQVETGWVRYGLRKPKLNVSKLPLKIRYTPDYLQAHRLVEVQAFGHDRILKVKVTKAIALSQWHDDHPVDMFVWDSTEERYGRAPWPDVLTQLCLNGEGATFDNDGVPYWGLSSGYIPVDEWYEYDGEIP